MGYNITYDVDAINISSPSEYFKNINETLDYMPGYGLLVIVYVGLLVSFMRNGIARAHVASSFITALVAVLLYFLGMIEPFIILIPTGLMVIGLIVLGFIDTE